MQSSATILAEELLKCLYQVFPENNVGVALHEPSFSQDEILASQQCIESGWISYRSRFVDQFEKELSNYLNIPHVILMVNGTAATHIALIALDLKPEEEVLMPALTFAATANAVAYCGAIPHFVDSSEENFGICVEKLEHYLRDNTVLNINDQLINKKTQRVIKGIIPVHVFGHPVDMDPLNKLAKQFNLWVLEDAAESLGSLYRGHHTGVFGDLAITSFNGNKIITTGGGGAVFTSNQILSEKIRHLSTTAKIAHPWEFLHDQVGYNYRLPGINAAIGCAQFKKLDSFLEKKRKIALKYKVVFESMEEIEYKVEPKNCKSNYWLNAILLKDSCKKNKSFILEYLNNRKIFCRGVWVPMHQLPSFKNSPAMDLSTAENLYDRIINLPSSPSLIS